MFQAISSYPADTLGSAASEHWPPVLCALRGSVHPRRWLMEACSMRDNRWHMRDQRSLGVWGVGAWWPGCEGQIYIRACPLSLHNSNGGGRTTLTMPMLYCRINNSWFCSYLSSFNNQAIIDHHFWFDLCCVVSTMSWLLSSLVMIVSILFLCIVVRRVPKMYVSYIDTIPVRQQSCSPSKLFWATNMCLNHQHSFLLFTIF